jgi:hypothetical protein
MLRRAGMSILGPPTDWTDLIGSMVPVILQLVITTWEGMTLPGPDQREDDISEALCRALRKNREARKLMFQIHNQYVELEPAAGEDLGRIDIAFVPLVPREDIYFCFECKRLNVVANGTKRAYAAEYVTFGVVRFVNGQYALAVRHGGMLGYVLDGDIDGAIDNVESNLRSHCDALGMKPPGAFEPSAILPGDRRARETHHRRQNDSAPFSIHHLFMGRNATGLSGSSSQGVASPSPTKRRRSRASKRVRRPRRKRSRLGR